MPNGIAYLALLVWPIVTIALFKRLSVERAILICFLGGYLLLPPIAEFNLPLVPDMDKYAITSIMVYVGCNWVAKQPVPLLPSTGLMRVLLIVFVFCVVPTILTNQDPIVFRSIPHSEPIIFFNWQLPALGLRDLGSEVINQMIKILPFLIAYRHLATPEAHKELVIAFMIAGLLYSIPSLIEIRFSPQTNTMIYGFFQHEFSQMMRGGGFRPIVFLPHALWLALFMFSALVASVSLARTAQPEEKIRLWIICGYLCVILILCKSAASIAYGLVFTPLVAVAPYRLQIRIALVIALIAALYPMLRNLGAFPLDDIIAWIDGFNPARAHSLNYRFQNEEQMLAHAADKPLFGWGGWGRNLIRDGENGEILTIPDGHWIIAFGSYGWTGYLAEIGLLAVPLAMLVIAARRTAEAEFSAHVACIAIVLGATMVDMLLNDTLVPITWMCAGAIYGYAEQILRPRRKPQKQPLFGGHQALGPKEHSTGPKSLMD